MNKQKTRKKVVAFLLSMLMLISLFQNISYTPIAEGGETESVASESDAEQENIQNKEDSRLRTQQFDGLKENSLQVMSENTGTTNELNGYLKTSGNNKQSYIKINGTDVLGSTGTVEVPFGSSVDLMLYWEFTDNSFPLSTEDRLTYKLPEGITFNGTITLREGSEDLGIATINGRDVTIQYTNEQFLGRSGRFGTLKINGTLNNQGITDGTGGQMSFEFPGLGTYYIDMQRDTSKDGVFVTKSDSTLNPNTMECEWTLGVKAVGSQTNIVLQDVMEDNMKLKSGTVKFYTDSACTTEYTGTTIGTETADGFQYTFPSLKDQTIYVKYTTILDKKSLLYQAWESDSKVSNTAKVKSDEQTTENTVTKKPQYTPWTKWATKRGVALPEGENGKNVTSIKWTVVINPDNHDISGAMIKDVLSGNGTDYKADTLQCTPAISGLTWENLKNGFVLPDNAGTTSYTITYETTPGDISNADIQEYLYNNTITVTPWNGDKSFSENTNVKIGTKHNYITKACLTQTNTDEVEWKITVNVPSSGMTDLRVEDVIPSGMTYVENSFNYTNPSGYAGSPIATISSENKLIIKVGQVAQSAANQEFIFTYKTKISAIPTVTTEYRNNATCYDGDDNKGSQSATYTYKFAQYLSKSGESKNNEGKVCWTLSVYKVPTDSISAVITDTLPTGLKYKENSLKATQTAYPYDDVTSNVEITESNGKLIFTLSGNALAYAKNGSDQWNSGLKITYDTVYTDPADAMTQKEYKNTAQIKVDNIACPEVTASVWAQLPKESILKKEKQYDETTAPNVEYTITVNEMGADLVANSDTLQLTDTMGSAIDYYMNSMTINGVPATADQVKYEASTHTLQVTVPDGQKVVLKYRATVNVATGTVLNDANAYNRCILKGASNNGIDASNNLNGYALESAGSGGSLGVNISIFKHKEGDQTSPLANAKFTCYRVDVQSAQDMGNDTKIADAVTTASGRTSFNGLQRNIIYKVVETQAPDRYALDATPHYIVFEETSNQGTYPSIITKDGISYNVDIVAGYQSTYTYSFENRQAVDIYISKRMIAGSSELAGASLELYEGTTATGTAITRWETTTTPKKATIGNATFISAEGSIVLKPGTYTLREISAPLGYAKSKDITFTVDQNGELTSIANGEIDVTSKTVIIRDKKFQVNINKEDLNGAGLSGASIAIYNADDIADDGSVKTGKTAIDSWLSTENGSHDFGDKLRAGNTYVLKEMMSPSGYAYSENIRFKVNDDGTIAIIEKDQRATETVGTPTSDIVINKITMKDRATTGTIELSKSLGTLPTGLDIATVLANLKFEITKAGSANPIYTVAGTNLTATTVGGATVYTWKQTDVPTGIYTVTEILTNIQNYAVSTTYTVGTTTGTVASAKPTFTVTDGRISKLEYTNTYSSGTTVKVSKTAVAGTTELPGAILAIYRGTTDADAQEVNKVQEWKTTSVMNAVSLSAGDYILVETVAPKGYTKAKSIAFSVSADGKVTIAGNEQGNKTIHMSDESIKDIRISKVSLTGNTTAGLAGAHLELYEGNYVKNSSSNILVEAWDSDATEHVITGAKLEVDQLYSLVETSAPAGFDVAQVITFKVGSDGSITDVTNAYDTSNPTNRLIVMLDKATSKFTISKKQVGGSSELVGAVLELYEGENVTGEPIASWTTGIDSQEVELGIANKQVNGKITVKPNALYTLKEKTAPYGYELADAITFKVDADGRLFTKNSTTGSYDVPVTGSGIVMRDVKKTILISKVDAANSEKLDGAKLKITDASGTEVVSWVTLKQEGAKQLDVLQFQPDTEYVLTEVSAPTGYKLADAITFKVGSDNVLYVKKNDGSFTMVDSREIVMKDEKEEITTSEETTTEKITTQETTTTEETTTQTSVTTELTTSETQIVTTTTTTTTTTSSNTSKKTGDTAPVTPITVVMLVAAVGIIILGVVKKKRNDK